MTRTAFLFAPLAAIGLSSNAFAQMDNPFKEGTVFEISMVHTEANSQDEYFKRLNLFYVPLMHKAQEQGLIKSFRILSGDAANEADFDVMLMVEYASMAMMDPDPAREAKWDALEKEQTAAMGGDEKRKGLTTGLGEVRSYKGRKLMREMLPK